ncbi:MAG TPA: sigma-70 family RNA polymerase sigma factor [Polyangiaceae bacterium]|nr:sigma-70 family RNA polymerase sigma factor [Polyangiaceae bacterium]
MQDPIVAQRDPLDLVPHDLTESTVGPRGRTTDESAIPRVEADLEIVARLRAGDAAAFSTVVQGYHRLLLHLCRAFVSSQAAAEDIVQETWMAVIDGLDKFEGRSSLRTWVYSIAVNRARMRRLKDGRTMPVSPLNFEAVDETEPDEQVDFQSAAGPRCDERTPENLLASAEATSALSRAIDALPPAMRAVGVLRDMEGLSSAETCGILDISEANQRVLLHRARSRLRRALAIFMGVL